jgi:AAA domain-containing protein
LGTRNYQCEETKRFLPMRVAVSGTHCCGKSTLIDEFLLAHPDFIHEPEPYTVLLEDYGEVFAAEPSPDDFYRQLEFNVERLRLYKRGQRVIFERSPVDFLAYLLALNDVRRGEGTARLIERSLGMVMDAIQLLDLIVFLSLNDEDGRVMSDSEDPELRSAVNCRLVGIYNDDDFSLFTSRRPVVLEAMGSTAQRLRMLESALRAQLAEWEAG